MSTPVATGAGSTTTAATDTVKVKLDKPYKLTPQSVIEYFYYEGWNRKNVSAMKLCLSDNIKFRGGLTTSRTKKFTGKQGFIDYMIASHTALLNNHCEIQNLIIDSSQKKAAARIIIKGVHKGIFFGVDGSATNTPNTSTATNDSVAIASLFAVDGQHEISFDGTAFFTFNDDCSQIIELWALADIDTLKNQIGATTESVFM
jgi:predicted ester cyclase